MQRKLTRKHCLLILNWCQRKWGSSKFQRQAPKLIVHYKNISTEETEKTYVYGEFDTGNNIIHIYLSRIPNLLTLCSVVIHEYWHFLQSPSEFWTLIWQMENNNLNMGVGRRNHPHEVKCNRYGYRYKKQCLRDLCF